MARRYFDRDEFAAHGPEAHTAAPRPRDGDGDGFVFDGTPRMRPFNPLTDVRGDMLKPEVVSDAARGDATAAKAVRDRVSANIKVYRKAGDKLDPDRLVVSTLGDRPTVSDRRRPEYDRVADMVRRQVSVEALAGPRGTEPDAPTPTRLPVRRDVAPAGPGWKGDPPTREQLVAAMTLDLGDGYTTEVDEGTGGYVKGNIMLGGQIVGTFSKSIDPERPVAEFETMNLKRDHMGRGLGYRFFAQSIDNLRALGVERVDVFATSHQGTGDPGYNGAYSWARAGYDWGAGTERHVALAQRLARTADRGIGSPDDQAAAREMAARLLSLDEIPVNPADLPDDFPTPNDVAMLGWTPGAESWFGREFLSGFADPGARVNWTGSFYLTDTPAPDLPPARDPEQTSLFDLPDAPAVGGIRAATPDEVRAAAKAAGAAGIQARVGDRSLTGAGVKPGDAATVQYGSDLHARVLVTRRGRTRAYTAPWETLDGIDETAAVAPETPGDGQPTLFDAPTPDVAPPVPDVAPEPAAPEAPPVPEAPAPSGVAAVVDAVRALGVELDLVEKDSPEGPYLELGRIVVPKDRRNEGLGGQAMALVTGYADETGADLFLTPSADFGGTKSRLERWYRGLGFKPNKGRSKDFRSRETMVRPAQTPPEVPAPIDEPPVDVPEAPPVPDVDPALARELESRLLGSVQPSEAIPDPYPAITRALADAPMNDRPLFKGSSYNELPEVGGTVNLAVAVSAADDEASAMPFVWDTGQGAPVLFELPAGTAHSLFVADNIGEPDNPDVKAMLERQREHLIGAGEYPVVAVERVDRDGYSPDGEFYYRVTLGEVGTAPPATADTPDPVEVPDLDPGDVKGAAQRGRVSARIADRGLTPLGIGQGDQVDVEYLDDGQARVFARSARTGRVRAFDVSWDRLGGPVGDPEGLQETDASDAPRPAVDAPEGDVPVAPDVPETPGPAPEPVPDAPEAPPEPDALAAAAPFFNEWANDHNGYIRESSAKLLNLPTPARGERVGVHPDDPSVKWMGGMARKELAAARLHDAIEAAPADSPELFRGVKIPEAVTPGETFDLPLTSFADSREYADTYGSTIIRLAPGAQSVDVGGAERVTAGTFRVVSVDGDEVVIEQVDASMAPRPDAPPDVSPPDPLPELDPESPAAALRDKAREADGLIPGRIWTDNLEHFGFKRGNNVQIEYVDDNLALVGKGKRGKRREVPWSALTTPKERERVVRGTRRERAERIAEQHGVDVDVAEQAIKDLPGIRQRAKEDMANASDDAFAELESFELGTGLAPPSKKVWGRLAEGGEGWVRTAGAEWDWFYELSEREQARLRAVWFNGSTTPDEAEGMLSGIAEVTNQDTAMQWWLQRTRTIDAAGPIKRGKMPAHADQVDLNAFMPSLSDEHVTPYDVFGRDPDEAAAIIAMARTELDAADREEWALRALGDSVNGPEGERPWEIGRDAWLDEVSTLEYRIENEADVTDAELDRYDFLAPPELREGGDLEDVHGRIMDAARDAGYVTRDSTGDGGYEGPLPADAPAPEDIADLPDPRAVDAPEPVALEAPEEDLPDPRAVEEVDLNDVDTNPLDVIGPMPADVDSPEFKEWQADLVAALKKDDNGDLTPAAARWEPELREAVGAAMIAQGLAVYDDDPDQAERLQRNAQTQMMQARLIREVRDRALRVDAVRDRDPVNPTAVPADADAMPYALEYGVGNETIGETGGGMATDNITPETLDQMAEAWQAAPEQMRLRAPAAAIAGIVADGRVKTQFETGTSGGGLHGDDRKRTENDAMGVPDGTEDALRPVYGYAGDGAGTKSTVGYGDVVLKVKPKVAGRTTLMFGDSLGTNGAALPLTETDVSPTRLMAAFEGGWRRGDSAFDGDVGGGFTELQFHGGLTLDDLEDELEFSPRQVSGTSNGFDPAALDQLGDAIGDGSKFTGVRFQLPVDQAGLDGPALDRYRVQAQTFANAHPDTGVWFPDGNGGHEQLTPEGGTRRVLDPEAFARAAEEGTSAPIDWGDGLPETTPDVPAAPSTPREPGVAPPVADLPEPGVDGNQGDWTWIGGQGGSNPGAWYRKGDANYYVKVTRDDDHAGNEVAANLLYELAGANVPEVTRGDDGTRIASRQVGEGLDDLRERMGDPDTVAAARRDFVADAWLANWDVAGMGLENIVVDADGKAWRIDSGGALAYRARGDAKGAAFGDTVGELDSLRDPDLNPAAARVFAGVTDAELRDGAERVAAVSDDDIRRIVDGQGLDSSVADTLIARRDDIARRLLDGPDDPTPDTPDVTPEAASVGDGTYTFAGYEVTPDNAGDLMPDPASTDFEDFQAELRQAARAERDKVTQRAADLHRINAAVAASQAATLDENGGDSSTLWAAARQYQEAAELVERQLTGAGNRKYIDETYPDPVTASLPAEADAMPYERTTDPERRRWAVRNDEGMARATPEKIDRLVDTFRAAPEQMRVRVPSDAIAQVLAEGRIRTQFETGTSRGRYDPDYRRQQETDIHGVGDVDDTARPVYGYVDDDISGNAAAPYGAVAFHVKSKVAGRTTLTYGDSLTHEGVSVSLADPVSPVDLVNAQTDTFIRVTRPDGTVVGDNYVETQFHGGLSVDDLDDAVTFQPVSMSWDYTGDLETADFDALAEVLRTGRFRSVQVRLPSRDGTIGPQGATPGDKIRYSDYRRAISDVAAEFPDVRIEIARGGHAPGEYDVLNEGAPAAPDVTPDVPGPRNDVSRESTTVPTVWPDGAPTSDQLKGAFIADLGDGYTTEADYATGTFVSGDIMFDGESVGTFERSIDPDKPIAKFNEVRIDREHQGKGVGSRFFAATVDNLRGLGVVEIHTDALTENRGDVNRNWNGAYSWARMGYDWKPGTETHTSIANALVIATLDPDFPEALKDEARALADRLGHPRGSRPIAVLPPVLPSDPDRLPDDFPTPNDVAMLGWTPGADDWPGKRLMSGRYKDAGYVRWEGVYRLDPAPLVDDGLPVDEMPAPAGPVDMPAPAAPAAPGPIM